MLRHMLEAIYPDDSRKAQPIIQAQITWHVRNQPLAHKRMIVCGLATAQYQYK